MREGEWISIDGTSGEVMLGQLALTTAEPPPEFAIVLGWADDIRRGRIGVRANADNGPDAARAREYGAEGIGLCRTEHMFLGERLPAVQRMILADTPEKEAEALAELLELQRGDFEEILAAMDGLPVTVRLLDPPLHEFLPTSKTSSRARREASSTRCRASCSPRPAPGTSRTRCSGTRGVRLGILKAGLYKMQVRGLWSRLRSRRIDAGGRPRLEIMIPLIVTRAELALVRRWVEEEVDEVAGAHRRARST